MFKRTKLAIGALALTVAGNRRTGARERRGADTTITAVAPASGAACGRWT